MAALSAGIRPLPILTASGQKGAGKSTLMRSIVRLFMGCTADLTDPNLSDRDFVVAVTNLPFVGIDNLDGAPQPWLPDAMASATTGQMVTRRKLFSDGELTTRPATAAIGVTTRTASFAQRPDLQERVLPVFTGAPPERRMPDRLLMGGLSASRDGCMAWLATKAAQALSEAHSAPNDLPGRFVDLERLVWAMDKANARLTLHALQKAQLLAVTDPDPLLAAIIAHIGDGLNATPKELVRELQQRGADLPFLGGGKAIANRVREAKDTLRLMGIRVQESTDAGGHTTFRLHRFTAEPAEKADSSNPSREKGSTNGDHKGANNGGTKGESAESAGSAPDEAFADLEEVA
jgi:hypothetical protein